jgi:two-component system LytT family response regulator
MQMESTHHPMRAVIVDDERRSREMLSTLLEKHCPEISVTATAESVETALDCIRTHHPDLLFLDIEMPYGSGFDLLENIRGEQCRVIFTTAYDQYAIKAIKYCALDYLLKPIDHEELMQAVARAQREIGTQERSLETLLQSLTSRQHRISRIALPTADELIFVQVDEIVRCEAAGNYTTFHLHNGRTILVARPLKEYDTLLAELNFFRVHHSHLVNLNYVEKYIKGEGGYVVMSDRSHVMVSRRRKEELIRALSQL